MRALLAVAAMSVATSTASAQSSDVTFFVIGKHANFAHSEHGDPTPVDFSFFSEIFLTAQGDAGAATLAFPTGETEAYRDMRLAKGGDRDNLLLVSGKDRLTSADALNARYPDGDYNVSFTAPSGDVDATLTFLPRPLPRAPRVMVSQNGLRCESFSPHEDLSVSWSAFEHGRSDPNDILDDLVFVILTDADGVRVAHSGRPFEERPYLTFASTDYTIPAEALAPNETYTLSVEHALLDDTTEFDGVPGFTTRAVTTKRAIRTGADTGAGCR